MKQRLTILWHYWRTIRHSFSTRNDLLTYQNGAFQRFQRCLTTQSRYFSPYRDLPLAKWPLMDKSIMLQHFDTMNTADITLKSAYDEAFRAEKTRDFTPTLQGYTVGLSSGTSGTRGVFLISQAEQARWAGTILAKMLPRSLFSGERIAFFLRANSNLYQSVNSRWLIFEFFDLFTPLKKEVKRLTSYQPTILIAPAQVLAELAVMELPITPLKVISVAEVLDQPTRKLIESRFGMVHEVYQATEGFLGATCTHGNLHLNEDLLIIEKEWHDKQRYSPIITDFTRLTQPIIRYRLDDILIHTATRCPCGNPAEIVMQIEGRLNDQLLLPSKTDSQTMITVFADLCMRAFAQVLPIDCDFRLIQTAPTKLSLYVATSKDVVRQTQHHLISVFNDLGINTDLLHWNIVAGDIPQSFTDKRRRIQRIMED